MPAEIANEPQKEEMGAFPQEASPEEAADINALTELQGQLDALLAENRALREENETLLQRTAALETEASEKSGGTLRQLTELKTALTDKVYLLVCAYDEAIEKIDRLIESLSPALAQPEEENAQAGPALSGTGEAAQGTPSSVDVPARQLTGALTEEKKVSIIETLKNSSKPAEPIKPTFGVTHKERANAKNLLQKYKKIK